jgi:integrase/recombinase XerC
MIVTMTDPWRGAAPGEADLGHLLQVFLVEKVARRELDPMTARNYRSALGGFLRVVGPDLPFTADDIGRWKAARADLRPSTLRSHFSMIRMFSAWLHLRGDLAANPTVGLRGPRQPRHIPRALNSAAVARLLQVAPDARARAIVMIMVGMGLRCVEVERLELGGWDHRSGEVVVRGKFDDERMLPVPAEVARAINEYLIEFPASTGPLIRSYRRPGHALRADTLSGMVSEWMRAAGVKSMPKDGVAAHSLRHTAASDVLDRCGDLRVVQEMLGHRNLATTSIYLRRARVEQLREAMEGRDYKDAG